MRDRLLPILPKRSVWADKTKTKLQDIARRKQDLDKEEAQIREACNHTYPDGQSAIVHRYDDEGGGYNRCDVCGY